MNILMYWSGDNSCLEYILSAFKKYNKTSVLRLMTDKAPVIPPGTSNVDVVDMSKYRDLESRMKEIYVNHSVHPYWYEFPSTTRWCVFYEYVSKNNLKEFFTSDWDVVYFCDITEEADKYRGYDLTLSNRSCAGSSYWFNPDALKDLSDMFIDYYSNPESSLHSQVDGNNVNGVQNINDMVFINQLWFKYKIYDTKVPMNDSFFCESMVGISDCEGEFYPGETQQMKKIKSINGDPYCFNKSFNKDIRINSMHFTSISRRHMFEIFSRLGLR